MPRDFLYETAITIDHELGTCLVDTTMRGVASTLLRRGFKELGGKKALPYRRFIGKARQISFRGVARRVRAGGRSFKITPKK